jgi:TRAP-type uncharacterized transport system fused permease subunit
VAPAAYVAAAIAGSPSMATGWTAMRFGWSSYIVPFIFVYSPAMLFKGTWWDIIVVAATSLIGIWLICAAMVGYFTRVMPPGLRLAFVAAGVMLMLPHQASTLMLWVNVVGFVLGVTLIVVEMRRPKIAQTAT